MQKCGTGALKEFMRRNPFYGYAPIGESHFFDRNANYNKGYEWYLSIQPVVRPEVKVFDKTPSYMSDQSIPPRIHAYNPDAKLIMLLCEPVHRTLSHYLHALFLSDVNKAQNKTTRRFYSKFESYNNVIDQGLDEIFKDNQGLLTDLRDVAKPFNRHRELRETMYRFMGRENENKIHFAPVEIIARGAYGYYIQQYLKWFPRENILILNSNHLKHDPVYVLKQVQEFSGVPVAVDAKNFVIDEETGHFCILGPEDLEPRCLSVKKNRSQDHTINFETSVRLSRIYKALKTDLEDIVGQQQFADWIYEDY